MTLALKIRDYFQGAISELKKVTWPTKKQTIHYSVVVVALSIGVAVFFGILDYALNIGLELLLKIKA